MKGFTFGNNVAGNERVMSFATKTVKKGHTQHPGLRKALLLYEAMTHHPLEFAKARQLSGRQRSKGWGLGTILEGFALVTSIVGEW